MKKSKKKAGKGNSNKKVKSTNGDRNTKIAKQKQNKQDIKQQFQTTEQTPTTEQIK